MKIGIILSALVTLCAWTPGYAKTVADNVKFSGILVALPCTIPDSDQKIPVNMGTINAHDLYLDQTMERVPFVLHLNDCDISLSSKVSLTFTGTEDLALPGFLGIDSGSGASGIAVGLEDSTGKQIKLNEATGAYSLLQGNNEVALQAYIAGEPEAIRSRAIETGNFSAIATLELNYE